MVVWPRRQVFFAFSALKLFHAALSAPLGSRHITMNQYRDLHLAGQWRKFIYKQLLFAPIFSTGFPENL